MEGQEIRMESKKTIRDTERDEDRHIRSYPIILDHIRCLKIEMDTDRERERERDRGLGK